MKSERRHDLQTNTLAKGIERLPTVGRQYGSKILLAVTLALLAAVLVRYWLGGRTERADRIATELSDSERLLADLRHFPAAHYSDRQRQVALLAAMSPLQIDNRRKAIQSQVDEAVTYVLNNSTDPAQQAEATVIRGDLYWELAQLGELREATTQPSLRLPKTPAELTGEAGKLYNAVLDLSSRTTLPIATVGRSRFGLAAVAEGRGDWAAARAQYEALSNNEQVDKGLQDQARLRLELLTKLQTPVVLGQTRQPDTRPAQFGPTFDAPTSMPVLPLPTQPSTSPAAPAIDLPIPSPIQPTAAPSAQVGPTALPPVLGAMTTQPSTQPEPPTTAPVK